MDYEAVQSSRADLESDFSTENTGKEGLLPSGAPPTTWLGMESYNFTVRKIPKITSFHNMSFPLKSDHSTYIFKHSSKKNPSPISSFPFPRKRQPHVLRPSPPPSCKEGNMMLCACIGFLYTCVQYVQKYAGGHSREAGPHLVGTARCLFPTAPGQFIFRSGKRKYLEH